VALPPPLARRLPPAYTPVPLSGLSRAARSLASGRDERDALARLLAERYDADQVVLTDSGTNALQLALKAVAHAAERRSSGAARPPRIALPAFACFDLVTAAVGARVEPRFFDLVPETLEPDWSSYADVLSDRIDAVVLAPLFGLRGGWGRTAELARSAGLPIIEDAAQGFGSRPGGRRAGSLGDLSVISFGRGKGWTGGGGGAVLARSPAFEIPAPTGRARGASGILLRSVAQRVLGHPSRYGIPASIPALHLGETRYHPPSTPARLSRASASTVLGSLEAAEGEAEVRRAHARLLVEGIEGAVDRYLSDAGYLRLPLLLPGATEAAAFAEENRGLGVERSYPRPLPDLPVLGDAGGEPGRWPGARALADRLVTLPTHSHVREGELGRLAERARTAGARVIGGA